MDSTETSKVGINYSHQPHTLQCIYYTVIIYFVANVRNNDRAHINIAERKSQRHSDINAQRAREREKKTKRIDQENETGHRTLDIELATG